MNRIENKVTRETGKASRWAAFTVGISLLMSVGLAQAQLPDNIVAELRKLGQVVEPGCTAKLIRPMMPKNDYNTYWPVDADAPNLKVKLFPGMTLARDVSYGPEAKDLIDIFTPDKGVGNRTVLIYVPGGAGNKLEQQSVEANAFYDNIGRWAAENGMVGVNMQRGGSPGNQGQNVAIMIEWLQANITKYKGNPDRMFIWAHSAGNGPLGQYIGRPDLYGVGVRGAIFMSGNPVNFGGGGRGAGGGAPAAGAPITGGRGAAPAAGGPGAATGQQAVGGGRGAAGQMGTSACINTAGAGSQAGVIRGPSSQLADMGKGAAARRAELAGSSPWRWTGTEWVSAGAVSAPVATAAPGGGARGDGTGAAGGQAGGGRGAGAGGRGAAVGGPAGAGAAQAAAPNPQILGFQTTRVAMLLARAELDPGVNGAMLPSDTAIHDELCKLEGPKAKDGVGHCPMMLYLKGHSHMSEVFSIGSSDKSVSGPILEWIKRVQ